MASNVFIPAGFEDSDDEEYDDYYDSGLNYNENHINLNQNKDISIQTNTSNQLMVNPNESKSLSPTFKRNALMRCSRSPSPASLVLDDIRLAVINGNLDYFKSQMECEPNFFMDTILKAGWTALMYASSNGHKDIVHYCLENGSDPNYHKDNFTPLMAVCSSGHENEDDLISCAQYLIKFGANVNAYDKYDNTPLIYASKTGKCGIIDELIKNRADINHQNKEGWTALHWAVIGGHGEVIEKLINSNIDLSLKTTNSKQTAADLALSKGHEPINDILEKVTQRINGSESNADENRRLSLEESQALKTYVKPIETIEVQQKNKTTNRNLETFLQLSDLSHYLELFTKNNISYNELVADTDAVLERIGIKESSVQKRIMCNVMLLHKQEWKRESLRDLALDTNITCPEIMSILANIANHLSRISETIVFLRNKIHKNVEVVHHENDITTLTKVRNETLQTLINTRCLYQDLQFLRQELNSIEDISEPQTPDVLGLSYALEEDIVDNNNNETKSNFPKSLVILSVGVLSVFALKYGNFTKENFLYFITNSIPRPNFSKLNYILITM